MWWWHISNWLRLFTIFHTPFFLETAKPFDFSKNIETAETFAETIFVIPETIFGSMIFLELSDLAPGALQCSEVLLMTSHHPPRVNGRMGVGEKVQNTAKGGWVLGPQISPEDSKKLILLNRNAFVILKPRFLFFQWKGTSKWQWELCEGEVCWGEFV